MLKKIVSMIVMAAMISAPTVFVHAAEYPAAVPSLQESNAVISPMFVGVLRIQGSLSITSSGTARGVIGVYPKDLSSIDYILTTASLVNSSGTKVKTWTDVKSTINSSQYFKFDQSYTLLNRGTYKLTYTIKCYKNGAVIDNVSSETATQTY